MGKGKPARTATAILAAAAGTGYASGREIVLFFTQLGWASWIGIAFAATVFGLLAGVLCHCAVRWDADSFAGLCGRLLGRRAAGLAGALHALLLALTSAVMLCAAGELGALALPLRQGFLWGMGLALLIALALSLGRLRALSWLGIAVLAVGVAFYGGLALDPRPPRAYLHGDVALALEGSPAAAILLALAYGAMNACLAAGACVRFGREARDPARVGVGCAGMLLALLACANAAILRGGRPLLAQALPTVLLAARWGLAGFWLSAGFSFLCATTTLAAAMGGLTDLLARPGPGRRAAGAAIFGVLPLLCTVGIGRSIGAVYPAVGWLCAALMLAAACRADTLATGGKNDVKCSK